MQELTRVWVNFHVSRKSGYYFWKALLPLYLLTALSMGTFHFSTDNLSDRYSTVSTYFLAAFASRPIRTSLSILYLRSKYRRASLNYYELPARLSSGSL